MTGDTDNAVPWLSDDEQDAWRGFTAMAQLVFASLDRQLQAEAGISHAYYLILAMLSEAPDRTLRMIQLAELTSTSQSRMSHAVTALEGRGWVRRQPCQTDRRGQDATLTDAGYAALVAAAPGHVRQVRRVLFDQLTPADVRALTDITTRVNSVLEKDKRAVQ